MIVPNINPMHVHLLSMLVDGGDSSCIGHLIPPATASTGMQICLSQC